MKYKYFQIFFPSCVNVLQRKKVKRVKCQVFKPSEPNVIIVATVHVSAARIFHMQGTYRSLTQEIALNFMFEVQHVNILHKYLSLDFFCRNKFDEDESFV